MPWVRIDEKAMNHPKIGGLPDGAFRLWVEGLAYCQQFLTDGVIVAGSLRGLRAFSAKRRQVLIDVGLWHEAVDGGATVHDYLDWNESKDQVTRTRQMARDRIAKLRGKKQRSNAECSPLQRVNTSGDVLCRGSSLREGGAGETSLSERAGLFCEWYGETHERIIGVAYIGNPHKDYSAALEICKRLNDLEARDAALVWFGSDDDFARNGTRTIPKFASRASDCLLKARRVSA